MTFAAGDGGEDAGSPSASAPVLAAVMGPFSRRAAPRGWRDLEDFFNPEGLFHAVHVISLGETFQYQRKVFGSICVYPIPPLSSRPGVKFISNAGVMLRGMLRLFRVARSRRVDLVAQTFGGPLKMGLPAVAVAKLLRLPSVITLHSDYRRAAEFGYSPLFRAASGPAWKFLFRSATAIRAVSHHVAQFAYDAGIPRERVHVIPNKEDLDKFREHPGTAAMNETATRLGLDALPPDAVVFLTVGRLIAAKNLDGMLAAVRLAHDRGANVIYLIAGDGPLKESLRRQCEDLGLANRVRFLGFIPHDDLRIVYHLSDVFLFATHYEGQPRAAVEAMLAGLPIICSNFGQICEIVQHGRDGLQVNPEEIRDIADAIERLAADPELRRQLGRHSTFDGDQFSVPVVNRQEAAFYRSVLADRLRAGHR